MTTQGEQDVLLHYTTADLAHSLSTYRPAKCRSLLVSLLAPSASLPLVPNTLQQNRMSGHASPVVPDYARLERRVSVSLQHSRLAQARVLPSELVRLIVSFLWSPLTSASRQLHNPRQRQLWAPSLAICTGWIHADTVQYDDWTAELRGRVMAGWRLRAIDGYGDRYVNGFSFTYEGPNGDTWSSEVRKGSHHRPSMSRLQLSDGERIVQVAVRVSKWMECCVFETSAGRRFQVGGRGSRWAPKERHASEWTHAGVTQLLLMPQSKPQLQGQAAGRATVAATYEALAFTYGVGGHVHNLGVYFQALWPTPSQPPTSSATPAVYKPAATPVPAVNPSPATVQLVPASTAAADEASAASNAMWSGASCLTHSLPHPPTARLSLLSSS